jgi:hypothetical protein
LEHVIAAAAVLHRVVDGREPVLEDRLLGGGVTLDREAVALLAFGLEWDEDVVGESARSISER